jgi:predicted nuclease of predicted toxin-antitoxin system
MRFKLDEGLPIEAAVALAEAGHDATTVFNQGLAGASDDMLYQRCLEERRAIVTLDVDFADIRAYPPEHSPGLRVIRLVRQDRQSITDALIKNMSLLDREPFTGYLGIVEEDRVRIRGTDENA